MCESCNVDREERFREADTQEEAAEQKRAENSTQANRAVSSYRSRAHTGCIIEQLAGDFTGNLLISLGITTCFEIFITCQKPEKERRSYTMVITTKKEKEIRCEEEKSLHLLLALR